MKTTDTLQRKVTRGVQVAAVLFLSAALAGCFKVDMNLSVADETVNGNAVIAVNKQMAAMFGMAPEDMLDNADSGFSEDVEGVSTEPYDDGTWVGVNYLFDGVGLDEFNQSGDGEGPRFVHDAQAGTYEFTFVMEEFEDINELDEGDLGGVPGLDTAALLDSFEIVISVTFPGDVIEHDEAAEVDGRTVTWRPAITETTTMRAVANESGPGGASDSSVLLVGAIAAALLAAAGIGGGAMAVRRSRRRGSDPAGPAPSTGFGTAPGQSGFGTAPGSSGLGTAPGGQGGAAPVPGQSGFGSAPAGSSGVGTAPGSSGLGAAPAPSPSTSPSTDEPKPL